MERLLVVDDEPMVLRVMKLALENAGYDVRTAADGIKAYEAISQQQPDALITDLDMPRMTGEELIRRLRSESYQFPIYVLTSNTALHHRDWSGDYDRLKFLEKPVSMRLLLNELGRQFGAEPAGDREN